MAAVRSGNDQISGRLQWPGTTIWEDPKARHEAGIIVREFAGRSIDIGGVATEGGGVAFMYAEGQFLAREQYLDDIQAVLGDRARAVVVRRIIGDVVLVKIEFPAGNGGGSC